MKRLGLGLVVLTLVFAMSAGTAGAAAPGSFTCSGGTATSPATIPAGTYTSLTVTGICHILGAVTGPAVGPNGTEVITNCNATGGAVDVLGGLTIAPGAFLDAGSCAPAVTVGGNVSVGSGGTFILGCSPFLVIMPPVPPFPTLCPGITTGDSIGGNVTADHPLALIFHANTIGGNLSVQGGGGGDNCNPDLTLAAALDSGLGSLGPTPAYTDFENNSIHGNATVSGMQGCWFGIFRDQVGGNVSVTNNTFADADATEVATNTVGGNLTCVGNSPAAQVGDSGGSPNTVSGRKFGECASL